jgi:MFS transporter, DHA3 family, macrolide efflux protein
MHKNTQPAGMAAFLVIWIGQIVSILASNMSQFALTIWMYRQTHSATAMGLMTVAFSVPFLVITPIAGVMVDRYNRKLMMMVSDLVAVVGTAGIFTLYSMGRLEFWHLYVAAILNGLGSAFQWPAYTAAIATLVPKQQLGRANGLMSLMGSGPALAGPLLAGALLPLIDLKGILAIDITTFFLAVGALAAVHVPPPVQSEEGRQAQGHLLKEAAFGFRYIFARPSLLGLQLVFSVGNLFGMVCISVLAPMLLARTNQNSLIYGTVESIGVGGAVAGGIIMSAWGGLKRRVHGVLGGWAFYGFFAFLLIGLKFGLPVWIAGLVLGNLASVFIDAHSDSIWQSKVAPDLQGRVYSARSLIASITGPIAPIIGGTLADYVLEPAMQGHGWLPGAFAWLVGSGPGSGMGLLIIACGGMIGLTALVGYCIPAIRNVEDLLKDQGQVQAARNEAVLAGE